MTVRISWLRKIFLLTAVSFNLSCASSHFYSELKKNGYLLCSTELNSIGYNFERQNWQLNNDTLFLRAVLYKNIIKVSPNLDSLLPGENNVEVFLLEEEKDIIHQEGTNYKKYRIINRIALTDNVGCFYIKVLISKNYFLGFLKPSSNILSSTFELERVSAWNKDEMNRNLYTLPTINK